MSTSTLTRPKVLRAGQEFITIAEKQGQETILKSFRPQLENYKSSSFRLLVAGEVKKGKSSFINTLLNEPGLLPTDTHPLTSVAWEVMYGKTRKYKIFFNSTVDPENPDRFIEARAPLETTDPATAAEYGTAAQNPENRKAVKHIEVYLPNPLLESGLVIIDSPGLGSLFEDHSEALWKHAPLVNAFCFVFDSESPATDADIENIGRFPNIAEETWGTIPPCFFLQTKIDVVDESTWQLLQQDNIAKIQKNLGEYFDATDVESCYFPINSTTVRDAPSSGFAPVLKFLEDALQQHGDHLARGILQEMRRPTEETLLPKAKRDKETFEREDTERDEEFRDDLERLKNFNKKEGIQQVAEEFDRGFKRILINTKTQLSLKLNPIDDNPIIERHIKELEGLVKGRDLWRAKVPVLSDPEELKKRVENIQSDCLTECRGVITEVLEKFQADTDALLKENAEVICDELVHPDIEVDLGEIPSNRKIDGPRTELLVEVREVVGSALLPAIVFGSIFQATTAAAATATPAGVSALLTTATQLSQAALVATEAAAAGTGTQVAAAQALTAAAEATTTATQAVAAVQGTAAGISLGAVATGVAIVAVVAAIAFVSYRYLQKRKALQTIQEIQNIGLKILRESQILATSHLDSLTLDQHEAVKDAFKNLPGKIDERIAQIRQELEKKTKLSKEGSDRKREELRGDLEQVSKHLETLKVLLGTVSKAEAAPSR